MTMETDDPGVKVNRALTESGEAEKPQEGSSHKWSGEGTEKSKESMQVFCDVKAYVSCKGYVGILSRAWVCP